MVACEIELNQILAFIEALNSLNLVAIQIDLFDKHPGCIKSLNLCNFLEGLDAAGVLMNVRESKVDLACLTNTLHVVSHLNDVGARVKL